jgi:hypothetical protein
MKWLDSSVRVCKAESNLVLGTKKTPVYSVSSNLKKEVGKSVQGNYGFTNHIRNTMYIPEKN